MLTIETSEGEANFATLLDLVARGEQVIITKHGKAVARLAPAAAASREHVDEVIAKLKALRRGITLGGLSWREFRDEGRR